MRADNVGDYPWLLNTVLTLLRGYARSVDAGEGAPTRERLVGALQDGGIDAVMFSNEASLPYLTKVEPITTACMARIIAETDTHAAEYPVVTTRTYSHP